MSDAEWLQSFANECGYLAPKIIPYHRYACVRPLMFTHAIIVGKLGDERGYDDQWCYRNRLSAIAALEVWDGTGEPVGWHRHPRTGRRIDENGQEYVNL
jgi:hypothetical protein